MAKYKKKKWFEINAPDSFKKNKIGETRAVKPDDAIGRTITLSLSEITGKHSKQKMNVVFQVNGVKEGEKLTTKIKGCELERSYIKRNTKRMKALVEAVTKFETKDGVKLKTKLLSFGRKGMTEKQEKEMRKKMVQKFRKKAKKMTKKEVFQEIIFGKIAAKIFNSVKKIYPISRTEITKTVEIDEE